MTQLNIKNPDEVVGKIIKVVCDDKCFLEDVVVSVDSKSPDTI